MVDQTAATCQAHGGLPRRRCRRALSWASRLEAPDAPVDAAPADDLAMIVGTGGTTGRPKGVMLTGRNLETMTALTLMGYPFDGRPVVSGAGAADPRRRRAVLPGAWPSAARS